MKSYYVKVPKYVELWTLWEENAKIWLIFY